MQDADIRSLVYEVLATYDTIEAYADVKDGVVSLVGEVNTDDERHEIEELLRQIEGVREVKNELQVVFVPADGAHLIFHPERPVELDEVGADFELEGTEYDLNEPAGTTDVMESGSEAEPFFPPTDLVVRPAPEVEEGYEVVGGFAESSMDDETLEPPPVTGVRRGDEEIADDVRRELRQDSSTTDLKIRVSVLDGVAYLHGSVPSLEDVVAAEEVASRVPGVVEVHEDLSIAA